ncbi:recombinase-like zinc beta ribbon protein [Actinokineospora cianjurensis]|uniref:Recombinase-like zinc beta ribbon protein n=1 Tax=Actinokineospora cianjurensis TaxID=585224 RepID=A0A421AY83_9PSEU|nr:recombinase-like zinc beta ribbon protein [Actinokineospora cianjurensis]
MQAILDGTLIPVCGYARISKDDERDRHGVNDQRRDNRRNAANYSMVVVYEFEDNDRSASKPDVVRPDFEAMLKAVTRGRTDDGVEIRGVIVVHEDRLIRRPGDYERFVEAVTHVDGRVYADERGTKDLYSEDVETLGLMGAVISKAETRKMRKRARNNHRRRAEDGKVPRGRKRFGWMDNKIDAHPINGPAIAKAAQEVLGGRGMGSIALEWQRKGIRTVMGNDHRVSSVRDALRDPRICGWRRINGGDLIRDEHGKPVVGEWDALVEPWVWEGLDAMFKARSGNTIGRDGEVIPEVDRRAPKYILTGRARCAKPNEKGDPCGAIMRIGWSSVHGWHTYNCPGKQNGGCGGVSVKGAALEEYVTEAVLAKLEEVIAFDVTEAVWESAGEYEEKEAKLARMKTEWTRGGISDDFFFSAVRSLEDELRGLRVERRKFLLSGRTALEGVADIRERWFSDDPDTSLDISQKRTYMRLALNAVMVHPAGRGGRFNPDRLELRWRSDIPATGFVAV